MTAGVLGMRESGGFFKSAIFGGNVCGFCLDSAGGACYDTEERDGSVKLKTERLPMRDYRNPMRRARRRIGWILEQGTAAEAVAENAASLAVIRRLEMRRYPAGITALRPGCPEKK